MANPQSTGNGISARGLNGPVVSDLAGNSTKVIAALDAKWAAVVLAGQAIDYAVSPEPSAALREVLRMTGLVAEPISSGRSA